MVNWAVAHFLDFHHGWVNIVLHVVGFAGLFYSIYRSDGALFAVFLVIVELGHFYNHVAGIKPYDLRPWVILWRVTAFSAVMAIAYGIRRLL